MNRTPHEIISKRINFPIVIVHLTIAINILYLSWWLNFNNSGNLFLYSLLFMGEIYHVWQAIGYALTVKNQKHPKVNITDTEFSPKVDVFITVCGEPVEIVEETVIAALGMDYKNHEVHILNDGYVAKMSNWAEIDELKDKYEINVITRRKSGGAKAGNINNALSIVKSDFFAVFDADHVPHQDFLKETMKYFSDKDIAIVQTPQYYKNREDSFLTQGAWEQQELFFGPISRGKNHMNAAFWCGTNAIIRRKALDEAGGIPEDNIAEDFLVSLKIHSEGWKSIYVPKILSEGLAPFNLQDYVKQQYRWARGSLEIIFKHNPIFIKKLTKGQKFQYLYSSSYYLNGVVVLIDALIPVIVLATNIIPVNTSTNNFIIFFFPFIISTVYLLMISTNHTITYRAIQLSMSLFSVHIKALIATIFGIKSKFEVTPKSEISGNYLKFAIPHILYVLISLFVLGYAIGREGITPNIINNASWIIFNVTLFLGFIRVAYPWEKLIKPLFTKKSLSTGTMNKNLVNKEFIND